MWQFSADEVHSVTFVVVWLRWCAHYIVGEKEHDHGHWVWWEDDEVEFDDRHVRGTAVLCDTKSQDARLFSFRWWNERTMSLALLVDTAKILEASGSEAAYDFPGWESTEHVLEFLKAEIKKASVESAPLRAFLVSAGVDEHQLSEAVPPPPRGVLLVDEVFDASVAPDRPFVRCGDCGIAHWRPEGADRIGAQFNCSCGQRLQLRSLYGATPPPGLLGAVVAA